MECISAALSRIGFHQCIQVWWRRCILVSMGFYVPAPEQHRSVKSNFSRASGIMRPAERPLRRSSTRASRSSVLAGEEHVKLVMQREIEAESATIIWSERLMPKRLQTEAHVFA